MVECPYCEKENEVCHDDGQGYEEDMTNEMQCNYCDKYFIFDTYISYSHTAQKADCLNGSNHEYELTPCSPKEFSKMRCRGCNDERELTEQEHKDFNIGTKEEYFASFNYGN